MWISDDNGNRCSTEYWGSETAARVALASLVRCSGCSDCLHCSDCSDCLHCSGCSDCSEKCLVGPTRSDGYTFFVTTEGRVRAGCRDFASLAEARAHWTATRGGTLLGVETTGILDTLEKMLEFKDRSKS